MISNHHLLLFLLVCVLFAGHASAFGAGALPPTSEFQGYVWRHGDITEVLQYLPFSFVTNHRFTSLQRRQVYFGNWLRDFSQVMDTTCLQAVPEPILRAIVSVMGFMEFGFATDEFDVTRDRLGVYTHVEHIDNPEGYAEDAKKIDERLRGPVDPRELEFDPKTGMKNYIANSGNGYDTSADYVRRQLTECIELGRRGKTDPGSRKESFIRLGAALHTLEDFAAHSNYTELCLHELGEDTVFTFVGDACRVKTPGLQGREVPPIVTGTFGMLDIFHSLLGEADDMAVLQSKGTLGQLEAKLGYGGLAFDQLYELIKGAIETVSKMTSADNNPLLRQLDTVAMIFKSAKAKSEQAKSDHAEANDVKTNDAEKDDEQEEEDLPLPTPDSGDASGIMNPNLLWQSIEPMLYLHDRMKKWLQESSQESEKTMSASSDQLGEYTNQLVYKFLAVMIESAVKELRNAVKAAKERVDSEAAKAASAAVYEDGATASNPSHSDLSKDHFSNVLNQPSGLVATVTTNWATQQIVKCWDDDSISADETIEEILQIMHHPAFPKEKTAVQQYMFDTVKQWWEHIGVGEKRLYRAKLSKESVRNRGHEAHELNLKDLEGRKRGAAEFPGSRPVVKAPPKLRSFPITWAIREVRRDLNWAFVTIKANATTSPRTAFTNTVTGTGNLIAGTARAVISTSRWVANSATGLAASLWPFHKSKAVDT